MIKFYGYNSIKHGLDFAMDLKLGQYMFVLIFISATTCLIIFAGRLRLASYSLPRYIAVYSLRLFKLEVRRFDNVRGQSGAYVFP